MNIDRNQIIDALHKLEIRSVDNLKMEDIGRKFRELSKIHRHDNNKLVELNNAKSVLIENYDSLFRRFIELSIDITANQLMGGFTLRLDRESDNFISIKLSVDEINKCMRNGCLTKTIEYSPDTSIKLNMFILYNTFRDIEFIK